MQPNPRVGDPRRIWPRAQQAFTHSLYSVGPLESRNKSRKNQSRKAPANWPPSESPDSPSKRLENADRAPSLQIREHRRSPCDSVIVSTTYCDSALRDFVRCLRNRRLGAEQIDDRPVWLQGGRGTNVPSELVLRHLTKSCTADLRFQAPSR